MRQFITIILVTLTAWSCASRSAKKNENPSTQQPVSDTATSTYVWMTELCENKGTYYIAKYTAEQLQNTYDLWFRFGGVILETDATPFELEDISKLDSDKLTNEYQKQKKYFNQMVIVNTPYWQKLKEQRIRELEDEYELKKIAIESYSNSAVLNTNRFSKACSDFVSILTSKDTAVLVAFWKSFAEKKSLQNGSPESYMARFYEKFNSKDRLAYAKIDLTTYGWYNCAAEALTYMGRDGKMEAEFNKLFSNIKSECDEP
ncbi:MAG TPA: hypothetical protein VF008_03335 [Niastella sp.]